MARAEEIVWAWHAALNAGAVDELVGLSRADIEVGGPRGTGRGSDLLREWFARAGISLVPVRTFAHEELVVVEQQAAWRDASTGVLGEPQTVASVFAVQDGQVARVVRYATLDEALGAAGLDENTLVPGRNQRGTPHDV